jgi:hypothetical protein
MSVGRRAANSHTRQDPRRRIVAPVTVRLLAQLKNFTGQPFLTPKMAPLMRSRTPKETLGLTLRFMDSVQHAKYWDKYERYTPGYARRLR